MLKPLEYPRYKTAQVNRDGPNCDAVHDALSEAVPQAPKASETAGLTLFLTFVSFLRYCIVFLFCALAARPLF